MMDTYQNTYTMNNPYMELSGMSPEEMAFLQQATAKLTESQKKYFFMVYSSKRRKAQDLLLFTILGFFGFAGIQRFAIGEIGWGILYFFTGGLCVIGTIVDIINNKNLANEYNRKMAYESFEIAKVSN